MGPSKTRSWLGKEERKEGERGRVPWEKLCAGGIVGMLYESGTGSQLERKRSPVKGYQRGRALKDLVSNLHLKSSRKPLNEFNQRLGIIRFAF